MGKYKQELAEATFAIGNQRWTEEYCQIVSRNICKYKWDGCAPCTIVILYGLIWIQAQPLETIRAAKIKRYICQWWLADFWMWHVNVSKHRILVTFSSHGGGALRKNCQPPLTDIRLHFIRPYGFPGLSVYSLLCPLSGQLQLKVHTNIMSFSGFCLT